MTGAFVITVQIQDEYRDGRKIHRQEVIDSVVKELLTRGIEIDFMAIDTVFGDDIKAADSYTGKIVFGGCPS